MSAAPSAERQREHAHRNVVSEQAFAHDPLYSGCSSSSIDRPAHPSCATPRDAAASSRPPCAGALITALGYGAAFATVAACSLAAAGLLLTAQQAHLAGAAVSVPPDETAALG